jgi:mono/diheme cytochrome c family protein
MQSVVACGNCHFQRGPRGEPLPEKGLSGGMVFDEPPFKAHAANITPDPETGIGRWTDAQLAKAIREGIRPDGSVIGPPMPIEFYRRMADDDLAAIIAYLRAQPPVKNAVPKSVYNIPLPPNYGPPVTSVKAPPRTDQVRYGKYLADIGHCMECHTPRDAKGMLVAGRPPGRRRPGVQGPLGRQRGAQPDAARQRPEGLERRRCRQGHPHRHGPRAGARPWAA